MRYRLYDSIYHARKQNLTSLLYIFLFFNLYATIFLLIYNFTQKESIMKTWKTPELEIKLIRHTSDVNPDAPSGAADKDLGTCSNPYWQGNGMSYEDASKNNPYWGGSWGN